MKEKMPYKILDTVKATCLECGSELYGRTDKKFCCNECKNNYNNRGRRAFETSKRDTIAELTRNYEILRSLLGRHVRTISLVDLRKMGFNPEAVSGCRDDVDSHREFACFNIRYFQTETRIFRISYHPHGDGTKKAG